MLSFLGPDGEALSLHEMHNSPLKPANGINDDIYAIRGFHSVEVMVPESSKIGSLLNFRGYGTIALEGNTQRYLMPKEESASVIDVQFTASSAKSFENAGSVHHIVFAVCDVAAQLKAGQPLIE